MLGSYEIKTADGSANEIYNISEGMQVEMTEDGGRFYIEIRSAEDGPCCDYATHWCKRSGIFVTDPDAKGREFVAGFLNGDNSIGVGDVFSLFNKAGSSEIVCVILSPDGPKPVQETGSWIAQNVDVR